MHERTLHGPLGLKPAMKRRLMTLRGFVTLNLHFSSLPAKISLQPWGQIKEDAMVLQLVLHLWPGECDGFPVPLNWSEGPLKE